MFFTGEMMSSENISESAEKVRVNVDFKLDQEALLLASIPGNWLKPILTVLYPITSYFTVTNSVHDSPIVDFEFGSLDIDHVTRALG